MTIEAVRTPDEAFSHLPGFDYEPHDIDDLPGYEGLRAHDVDEEPADAMESQPSILRRGEPAPGVTFDSIEGEEHRNCFELGRGTAKAAPLEFGVFCP